MKAGGYNPLEYYMRIPELKRAIDAIAAGAFSGGDRNLFQPIVASLLTNDEFLVFANYEWLVEHPSEPHLSTATTRTARHACRFSMRLAAAFSLRTGRCGSIARRFGT